MFCTFRLLPRLKVGRSQAALEDFFSHSDQTDFNPVALRTAKTRWVKEQFGQFGLGLQIFSDISVSTE